MLEHCMAHTAGTDDADALLGLSVCHIVSSTVWRRAGCANFLAQTAALVVGPEAERSMEALLSLVRQFLIRFTGVAVLPMLAAPADAQVSLLSREVQSAMTATGS